MSTLKGFTYNKGIYKYIGFGKKNKKMKGRKNQTINPMFVELCKFDKDELKSYLAAELSKYYKNVISNDGFLFVKGTDNVCLTAHMDTTKTVEYGKRQLVKDIYEYEEDGMHVVHSPQGIGGDDRCGVYMILKVLRETNYRPYIIFCEDEEIGCVGSGKFAKSKFISDLKEVRFIVQLDRRGNNDAVFYDDINVEFHEWVEKVTGYKEAVGSCSDISEICPACGISGVNLSCGYYNEHHDYEIVKLEEMERTYEAAVKLIKEGIKLKESFEYKEMAFGRSFGYGNYYNDWYNGDYGMGHRSYMFNDLGDYSDDSSFGLYISWNDGNGNYCEEYYNNLHSEAEGWGLFMMDYPEVCFNDVIDYELFEN